jgi:phosphatidylethanolamine-binding protein (PEBP) family uncharacterized protein
MAVYLGYYGLVELQRNGGASEIFTTTVNQADVNAAARRFTFDDTNTRLITGDRVTITTAGINAGSNLDFIAASGWGNNIVQSSWSGWVSVDDIGGIRLFNTFEAALAGEPASAVTLVAINRDIQITVDPTSNTWRQLAQVTDYELNTNVETADTSGLGDEFRSNVDTLKTGSGRLNCLWDYTNVDGEIPYYLQQLAIRTEIGQEFRARLYLKAPNTQGSTATFDDLVWYDVTAIVTASGVQFDTENVVRIGIDFVTTGAIQLLARTVPRGVVSLQGGGGAIALQPASGGGALSLTSPATPALPAPPTPFLITLSTSLSGTIGDIYKVANQPGSPATATNTSPDLSWSTSGTPSGTISTWRLRCYDRSGNGSQPDPQGGPPWWIHWSVDAIPAATTSIAQNGTWPAGAIVNNNDWIIAAGLTASADIQRANGWGGPLPNGHLYEFYVEAYDSAGSVLGRSNTVSLTSISP